MVNLREVFKGFKTQKILLHLSPGTQGLLTQSCTTLSHLSGSASLSESLLQ